MNWKLIFLLSLFGLGMAFATISLIPDMVEPICWLVIFIICAYFIVKNTTGKYFLHGFLVSLVNCVWITAAHMAYLPEYLAHHKEQADMFAKMDNSKPMMALTGILIGAGFGLILGLFAFLMGKIMKKKAVA